MGDFLDATLRFPAVIFTFALIVVVVYWVLVLVGGAALDLLDGDPVDDGGDGGGALKAIGLEGVPVTVALSLFVVFAWLTSIVGNVFLDSVGISGGGLAALLFVVLIAAIGAGVLITRMLAAPLRHVFHHTPPPSRADFVGRICIIRTSTVTPDFGQAEITSPDGSSALIQVRQSREHAVHGLLRSGASALVYDYDLDREFFWVCPVDPAMGDPALGRFT
ncbi:hypothetical protein IEU95_12405 [Hoyosella rhizosphaerae]|uniref:DUF1449 family protein n=1 Tax=Hoyosella rhizosphaerae TaxID=1755582 RepID=A0A916XD25_9ACTN|nr:hypothetical protein [Hoyosella rhizosphaerae]MBN4927637.1 hypothetical protein [Hoyosella rhizosphaerae]GGC62892.1 hypothetical protein GCM10011410_14140 [Hoyosella rhizosphaerae]